MPKQTLVQMDYGLMFLKAIDDGSSLAVLATSECDIRQVAFEMTRLVERVGAMLLPAARTEIPQ